MVKRSLRCLAACTILLLTVVGPAHAADSRQYILRTLPGQLDAVLVRYGLTVARVLRADDEPVVLVNIPADASEVALELAIALDIDVEAFERDRTVTVTERVAGAALNQSVGAVLEALAPTTPATYFGSTVPQSYADQAAGRILQLATAQRTATGDSMVAVIDTGVDARHPALRGVMVPGFDFTRDVPGYASDIIDLEQSVGAVLEQSVGAILEQLRITPVNPSTSAMLNQSVGAVLESLPAAFGHGTMVAGLVHYVAPTARIMPLKAFHADGTSRTSDLIRAVYYAVDHGARVINMSFTMDTKSGELARALNYAQKFRVIPVAAAGNEGVTVVRYPAGDSHAIAAAATSNLDLLSAFSNYGVSPIRLAAPGEAAVTAYPGGFYAAVSGTSFSTALLSGAVALQLQVCPSLSLGQVISDLSQDAVPVSGISEGRIDLPKALARSRRRH